LEAKTIKKRKNMGEKGKKSFVNKNFVNVYKPSIAHAHIPLKN